jgi:hypothetical protein
MGDVDAKTASKKNGAFGIGSGATLKWCLGVMATIHLRTSSYLRSIFKRSFDAVSSVLLKKNI